MQEGMCALGKRRQARFSFALHCCDDWTFQRTAKSVHGQPSKREQGDSKMVLTLGASAGSSHGKC